MSHLLDACDASELAYDIKTRESNRLVDEKKHTIARVLDNSLDEDEREIVEPVSM
jgi:hypothetical protein